MGPKIFMNLQLIFKTLFIIAVLSLLVIMGMHNPQKVELIMPELGTKPIKGAAALMFFGFFAIGFLAGTLVMAGGGKKGKKD